MVYIIYLSNSSTALSASVLETTYILQKLEYALTLLRKLDTKASLVEQKVDGAENE